MVDAIIAWAVGAPLEFVAVLCAIAGLAGLAMGPVVNERIHRDHPRC